MLGDDDHSAALVQVSFERAAVESLVRDQPASASPESARTPCSICRTPPGGRARGCQCERPTAPPPRTAGCPRRSAPERWACPGSAGPSSFTGRPSEPVSPSQAPFRELEADLIEERNPESEEALGSGTVSALAFQRLSWFECPVFGGWRERAGLVDGCAGGAASTALA
jgi:hypothetical protein